MMYYYDKWFGLFLIVLGAILLIIAVGDLLFRVLVGFCALALINHGLRLRGLPPLQIFLPIFFSKRWF